MQSQRSNDWRASGFTPETYPTPSNKPCLQVELGGSVIANGKTRQPGMNKHRTPETWLRLLPRIALLALACLPAASTGCSRTLYRRQADIDAYSLVREKATHPHWRLENYT